MGISLQQAFLLDTWTRRHALGGKVTTLGVQHLDFSRHDLAIALGRSVEPYFRGDGRPADEIMSADELFASCGFTSTSAVDVSDHEGADVIFDLNSAELPTHLAGASGLIVNGGTLEHVFHVPNALSNLTRMLAVGGCIMHILPCHNCVDHGFYQFGPTLVFDYYSAAQFDILESAAIVIDRTSQQRRVGRVFHVPEGAFGTGLIGGMASAPLLYVALVRKTPLAAEAPIPTQRLYAKVPARPLAAPQWFAPFLLAWGERPSVSGTLELQLGPFLHAGGLAWTCELSDSALDADSASNPVRSSLMVFEDERMLGPPHTAHVAIREYGGGAFSHWEGSLMISTPDGSDPNRNGKCYAARMPILPGAPTPQGGRPRYDRPGASDMTTAAATYVRRSIFCRSLMTAEFANAMQHGVMTYRYRGVPTLKCPMDLAIYADLLHELRPGTVLEFGSNRGGSALWLADTLTRLGLSDTLVYSLDIEPVTDLHDRRIMFRFCDTQDIAQSLPDSFIATLPRPLLVIDDASHNFGQVINVMSFFHRHFRAGDYIIIEDGVISLMGAEDLHGYEGGPFQAVHAFLARHPECYEIDRRRCDTYGLNVTWNPDGYIRRIA